MSGEQVYKSDGLKVWNRENLGGGEGTVFGRFSHTRHDAQEDWVLKEMGWMTLEPGSSIGLHRHDGNEDAYIVVKGEGIFTDSEGKETQVGAGDVTIARAGDSHALKNTGSEPLVFFGVIAAK